jgi:hypothetical protein
MDHRNVLIIIQCNFKIRHRWSGKVNGIDPDINRFPGVIGPVSLNYLNFLFYMKRTMMAPL